MRRFHAWGCLKKNLRYSPTLCQKEGQVRKNGTVFGAALLCPTTPKDSDETQCLHTPHCNCQDRLRCRLSPFSIMVIPLRLETNSLYSLYYLYEGAMALSRGCLSASLAAVRAPGNFNADGGSEGASRRMLGYSYAEEDSSPRVVEMRLERRIWAADPETASNQRISQARRFNATTLDGRQGCSMLNPPGLLGSLAHVRGHDAGDYD